MLRQRFKAASIGALLMAAAASAASADESPAQMPLAPAEPPFFECRGRDMMPEIKAKDPRTYTRLDREGATAENGTAVLWRIERAGIPHSYLFGTVHLTDKRITTLSVNVRGALDRSREIILEAADLSPEATAAALANATKSTTYADGRSLANMLTGADYEKVKATLRNVGAPEEMARVFRPWVITMLIAASDCERRKIKNGELVLDMKIAAEAKARGLPVSGLETIEEQLEAMTSVPDAEQVGMLRAGLAYMDRTDDLVETMVQLYLDRRIGATWGFQLVLAAEAGVSEDAFHGFKEKLIVERNRKMLDRAMPQLEKGGAFIAVGAMHLSGPDGLIALLRERGYTAIAVE